MSAGQWLALTLRDDLVLSAGTATTGEHRSLDFIPGSALRGAAAARLYRTLGPDDAWRVFHAGGVRFGDGLPCAEDGTPAYPTPLAFHVPKDTPKQTRDALTRNLVYAETDPDSGEMTVPGWVPGVQPEQSRGHHLTETCRSVRLDQRTRLRTSVDAETGLAAEGQLFGYAALPRGQRFLSRLDFAPGIPASLRDAVVAALVGDLRLGRSKASEYGRVRSETVAAPAPLICVPRTETRAIVWFLSDTALLDRCGQPTLQPEPHHFGLGAEARIAWETSFLRSRRYAPFNAVLGTWEREREVIERGSVLVIDIPVGADFPSGERQIGQHREVGLGRCVVDALLVSVPDPYSMHVPAVSSPTVETALPTPLLATWALSTATSPTVAAEEWARRAADEVLQLYRSARAYDGVNPETGYAGPAPSQWGRLLQVAKTSGASDATVPAICLAAKAISEGAPSDWDRTGFLPNEAQPLSFRAWLARSLDTAGGDALALRLGLLARLVSAGLKDGSHA